VFPNKTFYQKRILSDANVLSREVGVRAPFLFVDTSRRGNEQRDATRSWKNTHEAVAISELMSHDPDICRLVQDPRPTRIIVITPYAAQVKLLQSKLLVCPSQACTLDIATVDSFQGQEGDIVIVSTVRTHKVGFTDDEQRLNVAITRSKHILRVVGHVSFFKSFQRESTLRKLCEYAEELDLIVDSPH